MADTLERRAIAQDRLAGTAPGEDTSLGIPSASVVNRADAYRVVRVERIPQLVARGRLAIDEEHCAFGLRSVGSALAPTHADT
ncbi:hypothetical protein [Methylobacterium gossipiicola]|nr:hypothetical protein [Methylobacterium gossipiicola]